MSHKFTKAEIMEGNRRLTILHDHLLRVATPSNFNMEVIGKNPRTGPLKRLEDPECETQACMIGHACHIPALNELGLKGVWIVKNSIEYRMVLQAKDTKASRATTAGRWSGRGDVNEESHKAAQTFFRMTYEDVEAMFFEHEEGPLMFQRYRHDVQHHANRLKRFIDKRCEQLKNGVYDD